MAGEVHRLNLPQIDPQLPPGEGRNVVQIQCAVCHTPHYILNQPPFSRKVWTAEVAKMQTAYGAPIPEADATKIVNYLVAVPGRSPTDRRRLVQSQRRTRVQYSSYGSPKTSCSRRSSSGMTT